jgi:hypothetical protein
VEDIYGDDGWRRFNGNPHASMNWPPADDPWLDDELTLDFTVKNLLR